MKIYIDRDELWPFYRTSSSDPLHGKEVEWPEDLSYDAYCETMQRFWTWQDKLEELASRN